MQHKGRAAVRSFAEIAQSLQASPYTKVILALAYFALRRVDGVESFYDYGRAS